MATDEDFSLDEVVQHFDDLETAQLAINDLLEHKMVEFYWKKPKGNRDLIHVDDVGLLLEGDSEWVRKKSFHEAYVIIVATDKGWRWHQSRWKAD